MNEPQQYLYRILPTRPEILTEGPTAEEAATIQAHFEYLTRLAEEGTVFLFGRTQNADYTTFGIVIFRAPDETAARRIMHEDPAVKERVMRGELYPFRIAGFGKALTEL